METDGAELLSNIETDSSTSSIESRARNRMVAEGYKYHAIGDRVAGRSSLVPADSESQKVFLSKWMLLNLLLVIGVIIIACLVSVIIIQHMYLKSPDDQPCTTTQCVQGAAYILNKIDPSVDPCVDFYKFSCGNWEKVTQIPPSKTKYGSFAQIGDEIMVLMKEIMEEQESLFKGRKSTAIHKARTYYNLCMDEKQIKLDDITPALMLIKTLGSWMFTRDKTSGVFDPTKWNIEDALLSSHRNNFAPLFSMDLSVDEKNSSSYQIKFEQSGLTLGDPKEYFTNHSSYQQLKDAFLAFGQEFVRLLGSDPDVAAKGMAELYDFEQKLATIHVPRESLIDPVKIYHNMTLKDFQKNVLGDWLNIERYIVAMFSEIATVSMDTIVVVYTPEYFKKLQNLLQDDNKELLANYIIWQSVQSMVGYLPKAFYDAALKLDKVQSGLQEYPPRWKQCLSKVTTSLGFASGALYVDKHFKEESKIKVENMFEEIRDMFISNLDRLEWMDDTTRNYAKEKARGVAKMLGYPDFVADPVALDKHYELLTLVDGKFFESRLAILIYNRQKNLKRIGMIPDRTEWDMVPTEVNGYYRTDFNHIAFPAGILRPPLYNPEFPKSINFGSFGMICGHELTHGFDNKGRMFDKMGNMRNWWTNSSADSFNQNSQCFVDFYHNYTEGGTNLNGKMCLGENIADNGGMKMAYLAYKSWLSKNGNKDSLKLPGVTYSSDQLFFIGMSQIWCTMYTPEYAQESILTDVHSISKYRVLGSVSNSEHFAKAFNCAKYTPMNPEKKCVIW